MSEDYLAKGIAAAKAGNKQEARELLDAAIRASPNDERTWGWFYNVCTNNEERIRCLREVLRINPNNQHAKRKFDELLALEIPVSISSPNPSSHQPEENKSKSLLKENKMNLNIQFQMQDIINKREGANKKKSTATFIIIIGVVLLLVAIGIGILNILSASGSSTLGTLKDTAGFIGCCVSIAVLIGLLGIVCIGIGIYRRVIANEELRSAEEANQLLRNLMMAEEEKHKS